jgi:prophage DNA circulation protein
MSTPPPPRASMPRSSFAIAMKDYTFIRPGIAVTISAATLVAALITGVVLIKKLAQASATVTRGATASQALHSLNAKYEVWRTMATGSDTSYRAQADSIRSTLQSDLTRFGSTLASDQERGFVQQILDGLGNTGAETTKNAREAMIVLLGHQDAALFDAAGTSQEGVLLAATLLALTILAAGLLIVPMAWLYIRFKRGAAIEVKV